MVSVPKCDLKQKGLEYTNKNLQTVEKLLSPLKNQ